MDTEEAAFQAGAIIGRLIGTACLLAIVVVVVGSVFMVVKALTKKKPPA